ncbi:UNVERIFIED_CONTAM: hypothetical protein NCL1_24865 [Trichonephila clavipes]
MHQRSSVGDGRSLPTSSDVTNQWSGLVSRRCWSNTYNSHNDILKFDYTVKNGITDKIYSRDLGNKDTECVCMRRIQMKLIRSILYKQFPMYFCETKEIVKVLTHAQADL